jgi:branched-chain amino acid transport system ATP-binding protein
MSAGEILRVDDIDVFYGASQILFGVSFGVEKGQSLALLGRNGAGKSTTMKAIIGIAPARRGRVSVRGTPVQKFTPDRIAREGVGFVPEDRQIFPEHSVEDNLKIAIKPGVGGRIDWTLEKIYDVFPILASMRGRMGGRLSGGEQQMLTMCRTLMGDPDLVLIDEPTEGLAPKLVEQVGVLLDEIARRGVAILLVEQKLTIALKISTRLYVMGHGHIVFEGDPASLAANENVRKEWLEV